MAIEEIKHFRLLIIRAEAGFYEDVAADLEKAGLMPIEDMPLYVMRDGIVVFCGMIDNELILSIESVRHILGIIVWGGPFGKDQWTTKLEKFGIQDQMGFIGYLDAMNQTVSECASNGDILYEMPPVVFLFIIFSLNVRDFMMFVDGGFEDALRKSYENIEKNNPAVQVPMYVAVLAFELFWVEYARQHTRILNIENEIMENVVKSANKTPSSTTLH